MGEHTRGGALWGNSHEMWGIMGELTREVGHYGGTHMRGGALWGNSHERWGIMGEHTKGGALRGELNAMQYTSLLITMQ